jgi:hypothetical protein
MQVNMIARVAWLEPTCAKILSARKGPMSQSITGSMVRPNMRMQPDAATRPQDRVDFDAQTEHEGDTDLLRRRG